MKIVEKIKINNIKNNNIISQSAHRANSYFRRLIGLMFRKTLSPGEALIINPCSSVHTHWMRFAIDVIYVNKDNVVVGIDHNLKPWRLGRFYKKVQYVIELPAGTAQATNTQPGDIVSIQEQGA
ncbi:MAG: DUF192 domain-containing protein [Anaerolineae bacterium]